MNIRPFVRADTEPVVRLWQQCGLVRPWNDPRKDIERKLTVQPGLFLVGVPDVGCSSNGMSNSGCDGDSGSDGGESGGGSDSGGGGGGGGSGSGGGSGGSESGGGSGGGSSSGSDSSGSGSGSSSGGSGSSDDAAPIASAMVGYDGHRGWVNYLAVSPGHRGRGHGRALMAEAERLLIGLGCPKLNLQVRDGNDSVIAFYGALGYAPDRTVSLGKRLIAD